MRERTWQPAPPKSAKTPPVPVELREAVLAQAAPVVSALKKRSCKKPKNTLFNWCEDILVRWHRDALYFVAVMRTPHGRPPTFETRAARMAHAGDGKFDLAVPMRRGSNTIKRDISPEECLKEIVESAQF